MKLTRVLQVDGKLMIELPASTGLRLGSMLEVHQEGPAIRLVPRDATRQMNDPERQAMMDRLLEDPREERLITSRREAQTPPPKE